MVFTTEKQVQHLVVDTSAFIQNVQLQEIAQNITTAQDVVDEITNKRQLRRLCVLPYDLTIKDVDPEDVKIVTSFAKKTGDYPSLSAIDIKVIALTYKLEKELVGTEHLHKEPTIPKSINVMTKPAPITMNADVSGFYLPGNKNKSRTTSTSSDIGNEMEDGSEPAEDLQKLKEKFETLNCEETLVAEHEDILVSVKDDDEEEWEVDTDEENEEEDSDEDNEEDDEDSWITPANVKYAKKQIISELIEEKQVMVACMTTDFAMQNVLKQMNLNVAALDGRMIKQLRTYILRCYSCFSTTSLMTKTFCPKCGNKTLKRVAVSLDENGKQQIHINARRPLTGRGKRFSLPTMKGGKHSNNPIMAEDQPVPQQRATRLARMKNNPLDDEYIAGFSPFTTRDVNSRSALLCIRPGQDAKHWMKKNPNEARKKRK